MKPKVLLYDIETSPNVSYTWGKWEQNVIAFKKEFEIISFAYKWLEEKEVYCVTKQGKKTDFDLCVKLHRILSSADVIVAHNGDSFDNKKSKARFAYHKLKPLRHLATIDTKKVAKNAFAFNSNSLNDIGVYLGLGEKQKHTGFDLWLGCMSDDEKSWQLMKKYNKQDVVLLEKVYLALRPWMNRHPNLSLLQDIKDGCPKCGSLEIVRKGYRSNFTSKQVQLFCKNCSGWFLKPFRGL